MRQIERSSLRCEGVDMVLRVIKVLGSKGPWCEARGDISRRGRLCPFDSV